MYRSLTDASNLENESADQRDASEKDWLTSLFSQDHFMRVRSIAQQSSPLQGAVQGFGVDKRFGNLPFSSALRCNQYPVGVQNLQERNLFVPAWAMQTVHGTTGSADPFEAIFADLTSRIAAGAAVEDICGPHAFLGALDEQEIFERAPLLSQQIARIVHSVRDGRPTTTFTHYALMHWYWALWRWMLNPSAETYCNIPAHGRPTLYQLFVPHPRVFDFLVQPNVRDLMCQQTEPDVRWLSEGAATIECDWAQPLQAALCRNTVTGEIDFSADAQVRKSSLSEDEKQNVTDIEKAHIATAGVWSFGPTIRPFLENSDVYVRIR